MQQAFYTSVSNARNHEDKKGCTYKSDPIPLLKENFLDEFRSNLEKLKVRKNLGIPDEVNLRWENIQGNIDAAPTLLEYINKTWSYSTPLYEDVQNVKDALDKTLEFVSVFKSDSEAIREVRESLEKLLSDFTTVSAEVASHSEWIEKTNATIASINETLASINDIIKISETEGNALKNDNGLYVKDLSGEITQGIESVTQDLTETIESVQFELNEKIGTVEESLNTKSAGFAEDIKELLEQGGIYTTELDDDLKVPITVGGISEGTKVSDLEGKTINNLLDTILFPTILRKLVQPTLVFKNEDILLEANSTALTPELEFEQGDAGTPKVEDISTLIKVTPAVDGTYKQGVYKYTAIVEYNAGEYLTDNKGNVTNTRIEEGSLDASFTVTATYPWYADGSKQTLVPYNEETEVEVSLTGNAEIMLPGLNSQLLLFLVYSGLGWLDVNMEDWELTTIDKNGTDYKVWTKKGKYSAIERHKLKFILRS